MTWTSCFNVNVFVSYSYLLIHLLSFLENPSFLGKAGLDRICSIYFSFSLETQILPKKCKSRGGGD